MDNSPESGAALMSAVVSNPAFLRHRRPLDAEKVRIKLSILMAAYNEQRTIAQAVDEVLDSDYPCDMELIIVDDGSIDGTWEILELINDPRVLVHRHAENQGKGSALRSAAALATGTHILPFDADLEYVPEDIARIVQPVLKGRCDVVYGARIFGFNTVYHSYHYAVGNRILTRIANVLFNAYLSDLHTCLKLIPLPMFRGLVLRETGFGLDTEITALLLKSGVRPFEVPVSYYSRTHAQGKKINWRDAVACLSILIRVRLHTGNKTPLALPQSARENVTALVPAQAASAGLKAVRSLGVGDETTQPIPLVTS